MLKLEFSKNYDLTQEKINREKSFIKKKMFQYIYRHDFYLKNLYNGFFNNLTSNYRSLPDFIIPGFAKCGTTSLFYYLSQHDSIVGGRGKEIHYFSWGYFLGTNWYKAHFPIRKKGLSFEASTSYMTHPEVPARIKRDIPNCKFIIILRNPIDRSYSSYHQMKRAGLEKFTFEECVEQDDERLEYFLKTQKSPKRFSPLKRPYYRPHISISKYAMWIKPYLNTFEREQFLFINFDDLAKNPQKVLDRIFSFLELEKQKINNLEKQNTHQYSSINTKTKSSLQSVFRESNLELKRLTGVDF